MHRQTKLRLQLLLGSALLAAPVSAFAQTAPTPAGLDDIVEHINTIKYGVRDTRERTREELEHVACHEAGHILLSQLLNPEVRIANVSITGRGNSEGFVEYDSASLRNRRLLRIAQQSLELGGIRGRIKTLAIKKAWRGHSGHDTHYNDHQYQLHQREAGSTPPMAA